jgi:uncharacterized protein (DUF1684 family)
MNRVVITSVVAGVLSSVLVAAGPSYDAAATEAWRATREKNLKAADGWLTVAGIYFLKPGKNTVGSDPSSDVVLPGDSVPAAAGIIEYTPPRSVVFSLSSGVTESLEKKVAIGTVTLQMHRSGDRLAIRVRDPQSPLLKTFTGLKWYPVDAAWAVPAKFVRYETPKRLVTQNILGDNTESISTGEVEFVVGGVKTRLVAFQEGEKLSFVFSDSTAGKETYRIRFLSASKPDAEGNVVIDFNRAYNPPCAFNPFTTCPVPVPQNRLKVPIAAGEKVYKHPSTSSH